MYLLVFAASLALALVTTPMVIWLATGVNAMDRPGVRTVHSRPIARIGGIAIYLSVVIPIVAIQSIEQARQAFLPMSRQLVVLAATATIVFAIGLIDDLRGLPARVKLTIESISALVLYASGISISSIEVNERFTLNLGLSGIFLTWLWIVGITNAVNLSDGLDGLAAGISAITCAVISIFSLYHENVVMAILTLSMLGGLCGFLAFNFHPARVFMGDCGSLFVGFSIAAASVACLTKSSTIVALTLPMLAMGVPIFDTLFSILRRFLERRSIFAPDKDHLHHRLLAMGLNQEKAVLAIYGATLVGTGLGLMMMVWRDVMALCIFCCIAVLILFFRLAGAVQFNQVLDRLRHKYAHASQKRHMQRVFEELQLHFRHATGLEQWWQAVCQAGRSLGLESIDLIWFDGQGKRQQKSWHKGSRSCDGGHLVTMYLPISKDQPIHCRIAIPAGPSLEWAGQKVAFFGRLVDESRPAITSVQVPVKRPKASKRPSPGLARPAKI